MPRSMRIMLIEMVIASRRKPSSIFFCGVVPKTIFDGKSGLVVAVFGTGGALNVGRALFERGIGTFVATDSGTGVFSFGFFSLFVSRMVRGLNSSLSFFSALA